MRELRLASHAKVQAQAHRNCKATKVGGRINFFDFNGMGIRPIAFLEISRSTSSTGPDGFLWAYLSVPRQSATPQSPPSTNLPV